MIPNVLSIAGSDPSGGAGIQADLKVISALGGYAMAVITAATAQNTQGVRAVSALSPAFVADQIDAIFEDIAVDAVKVGMVANAGIAEAVADRLAHHRPAHIVVDPVMMSKSGHALLDVEAAAVVRDRLVPLATILTPNLPEAAVLLNTVPSWTDAEMRARVPDLRALGPQWVLLKGGHLDGPECTDILHGEGCTRAFSVRRIGTRRTHGTGCTLSAALATLLPQHPVLESVGLAKRYLTGAIVAADALDVGRGHGPLHHFHALWAERAAP